MFDGNFSTSTRKIAENTAIDRASEARSIAVFSAIFRAEARSIAVFSAIFRAMVDLIGEHKKCACFFISRPPLALRRPSS